MGCGTSKPIVKEENHPEEEQRIQTIPINTYQPEQQNRIQVAAQINAETIQIVKSSRNTDNAINIDNYIHKALDVHNKFRALHKVPLLQHDPELSKRAQRYADQLLRERSEVKHSDCMWDGKRVGENLAWISGGKLDAKDAVELWYNEIKDYNFDKGEFSMSTGHFTQVVWKGSQFLGIGVVCGNGQTFVVGNYYPPGNYQGCFQDNVFPK
jgi:uncharacterized protein YkwD